MAARRVDHKRRLHLQFKLTLFEGRDDDLIKFLSSVPRRGRAEAVIRAMRVGVVAVAGSIEAEKRDDALDLLTF